jgi:hypothetical protein
MAQYPLQSDDLLGDMSSILAVFHQNKNIFIENGSRSDIGHLNIPKAHALPHILENMRYNGAAINFTMETPEYLHIPMCKVPYKATNRRDVVLQMLRMLDISEKIHFRSNYMAWKRMNDSADNLTLPKTDDDSNNVISAAAVSGQP